MRPLTVPAAAWISPAGAGAPGRALLASRRLMVRRSVREARAAHPTLALLQGCTIGGGLAVLLGGVVLATALSFRALGSTAEEQAALSALFALVALGGLLGTASAALQALHLATDLPLLRSLPIPPRVIYAGKFLDVAVGALPAVLVGAAILGGYGAARAATPAFGLAALMVGLVLAITVVSFGIILVTGITRFVPTRWARPVLLGGFLAGVAVVGLGLGVLAPAPAVGGGSDGMAPGLVAAGNSALGWTPIGWGARSVVAAAHGRAGAAFGWGVLFAGFGAAVAVGACAAFGGADARDLTGLRSATTRRRRRPTAARRRRWGFPTAILPRDVAALVRKEWTVLRRDLGRLSAIAWPLAMVLVTLVGLGSRTVEAPAGAPELGFWLSRGPLVLLPWGVSVGIAIYAFGAEGQGFRVLRTLPVSARRILAAKIIASLIPALVASEAAAIALAGPDAPSAAQLLGMMAIVAWVALGCVVVDTAAAAVAPNFAATQVQRSTAFGGRLFGVGAGAAFCLASGGAIGRLVLFTTGAPEQLAQPLGWSVGPVAPLGWPLVVGGLAASAALLFALLRLAETRLESLLGAVD